MSEPAPRPARALRLAAGDRAALQELAGAVARRASTPALAYGAIAGGRLEVAGGIGDPGDGAGPPDARTLFRIASMTKSFTAAAVLRLRDAGRLALDDAVARYVPAAAGLRPPTADSPAIAVRHLLTMSSGLATDDAWADRHLDVAGDEFLGWVAAGPAFAAPPGTAFEYSNLGYGILGQMVESVAGVSLQDYVSEHFLDPLGMADTLWDQRRARAGTRIARPYRAVDGAPALEPPPLADGALAPMGGLWSTVEDLARWVAFLADAFPPRDGYDTGPLRRASRREMQQIARAVPASLRRDDVLGPLRLVGGGYGMGLQVVEHLGLGPMVTHSGGLPGFGSNMRWLPDRGVGVVAVANVTYAPMAVFTRDALELLHRRGALPRALRPGAPGLERAAAELGALLSEWCDERATALLADNAALDDPLPRRRAAAARLGDRHGPLAVAFVGPDRTTRGAVDLAGERGRVRVAIELAPWPPGHVQRYDLVSVVPATPALLAAMARLAALAAAPDLDDLASLLEPGADVDDAARRLRAAHDLFGHFAIGALVAGSGVEADGVERATLRWRGERGDVDVTIAMRAGRVRVERVAPRPVPAE